MTVTEPLANPTATWLISSRTTRAETGNCLLPFCTATLQRHFGAPVFFSVLSNAQTLRIGSVDRFSEIVTRKAVLGTCLKWVIDASGVSEAWKLRTTVKVRERTRTEPSEEPRKRASDPVVREIVSCCRSISNEAPVLEARPYIKEIRPVFVCGNGYLGNIEEWKLLPACQRHSLTAHEKL